MFSTPVCPWGSTSTLQSDRPTVRPSDLSVRLHRGASTNQVPVSEGRIDPADGRPHLVLAGRGRRETGALTRVGTIPGVGQQIGERGRRVLQQVVVPIGCAGLDLASR